MMVWILALVRGFITFWPCSLLKLAWDRKNKSCLVVFCGFVAHALIVISALVSGGDTHHDFVGKDPICIYEGFPLNPLKDMQFIGMRSWHDSAAIGTIENQQATRSIFWTGTYKSEVFRTLYGS